MAREPKEENGFVKMGLPVTTVTAQYSLKIMLFVATLAVSFIPFSKQNTLSFKQNTFHFKHLMNLLEQRVVLVQQLRT